MENVQRLKGCWFLFNKYLLNEGLRYSPYSNENLNELRACNILVAQNIQSRIELQNLSWIGNWMISYQNHSPYFGCYQDSLIGSCELTRTGVEFDKYHAMNLFGNININGIDKVFNFDKEKFTGRDLVSKFLPKINYPKKKANIYMPQYSPFIKYEPEEIYVQINRGELVSGCLDNSTVGQGKMGSIFHVINNEYGSEIALETIYNFQQITSRYFLWSGYTIGIKDINLTNGAITQIKIKTQAMLNAAEEITEKLNRRELISPIGTSLDEYYEMEQLNALEPGDDFVEPILKDINFKTNKMTKMVFSGSKGKITNVININGAYGQTSVNGKRPPRNFSWGRTSPFFPRYDMSPASLGFIATSYREGISPEVFPFAAGEARHGAISNALSTSISGAQSRLNIKNLESISTDNSRKSVKGNNIIQPLYAESGIDPRKTEKVIFLTALISDDDMEKNYHSNTKMFSSLYHNEQVQKKLDIEYQQLLIDRKLYRDIYIKIENNNPGQFIIDNEQQMPINPFRIIEDVVYNYLDIENSLKPSDKILDPVDSIEKVKILCELIPYAYYNNNQEKRRMIIPEFIEESVTLLKILIRTYLCTSNLYKKKINNFHLRIIIDKIKMSFKNSLIDYGSTIGIIAAQCLSEPLTQYVLDSKHRAGGGGSTKTNTIVRIKEILGAKPTDKMKNTSMLIMVKEQYEQDKLKVQEIANHIEMMNFERFIVSEKLFFEEYGNPVHPDFKHETKMIKEFEKYNRGIVIPQNLSKWCIRYELNKEEMIVNNMKLDTIIMKLRLKFPNIYFIYSPENSNHIIIRCYISNNMIKIPSTGFSESIIIDIIKKINESVIRGIKDIKYTEVINVVKSQIQPDNSIQKIKVYGINTVGTNLEDVLDNPYVDKYRTQTDSIEEIQNIFGIEAARNKIINEIRKTMPDVIPSHCTVFADEMTYSGNVTSIQKTGLQIREMSNVSLRLSFQSPIQVIENAAINGLIDDISGISGPLILGQSPNFGTTYNNVCINQDFVENYMKNLSKNIDDEL
jgi:DNA-directed RNA polymerase II subunit RPB1